VALDQVDQILIGSTIEVMAAKLAYQQWKLQHAIEPKFATDDGSPDGARGQESALVGKAAPDFELDMLAGPKFRLSARKGTIVVLDFWATWCGPCIQSLPQVDQVARDFADRGVQIIAVNLEEAPGPVKSMFERHKLTLPVALDREGTVGGKYGVTSIPQTVVIDREGKVYRHFIGGGPRIGEELAGALKSLLDPPANPSATQ
jgi:peroxiredoxin